MPARLDPFVDVMLREKADQLYLLPDEPVTLVKDGKPRKVSKQPLTDQHIYALMVEVAPPEAADKIDQESETEFDYAGANGLVRVRLVPEAGRLTAVISAIRRPSQEQATPAVAASPAEADVTAKRPAGAPPPAPAPKAATPAKPPRASVIAGRRHGTVDHGRGGDDGGPRRFRRCGGFGRRRNRRGPPSSPPRP